jgi:hypothetical protein
VDLFNPFASRTFCIWGGGGGGGWDRWCVVVCVVV